ncbi:MAG TPA: hypothetical protein DIW64_22605 [Cellvibrio sp.]|nr:hypothetical protein [Cellvibrio sp.]
MKIKFLFLLLMAVSTSSVAENCWVHNCDKFIEVKVLRSSADFAERKGESLKLKLIDGATVSLNDSEDEDIKYYLIAYFPEVNYAAIETVEYSGEIRSVYLYPLKDAKAFYSNKRHIGGFPVLSPDRKRIAVFGFDIHARFSFNGLSIYNIESAPSMEFGFVSDVWGVSDVAWVNNNELSILKTTYNEEMDKYPSESATLKFKDGNIVFGAAEKSD